MRWRKDEIKWLLKYSKEGLSNKEIAKRLNRTKDSIDWKLYKNLKIRKNDIRLPKFDKKQLYNLYYKKRLKLKEIAKMFNCSRTYIFRQMEKFGIPRDRKRCRRKPLQIPNRNYKNLTPKKAYIFGVLCGDGSISKCKVCYGKYEYFTYNVNMGVTDKDYAKKFKNAISNVYGVIPSEYTIPAGIRKSPSGYSKCKEKTAISLNRKRVYEDLRKYGNFKTENWSVPKEIVNSNDEEVMCSFLRGFFDSDGSVDTCGRAVDATSSNSLGLEDICILLRKIGILTHVESARKDRKLFRIRIYFSNYLKIFQEKINFSIKRKRQALKIINQKKEYRYSADDYWRVLRLRSRGYSSTLISNLTGFPRSTVKSWFKRPAFIIEKDIKLGKIPKDYNLLSEKFIFLKQYNI